MVVVGDENPFGSRWRNSSRCSRRAARKPEVRSAPALREVAGQAVEQIVAPPASGGRLRRRGSGANHEIVLAEAADEADSVAGVMLTVAVHHENPFAGGVADAGLQRRAVALVVRMTDDDRARLARLRAGVVGRAVVDDQDLLPRRRPRSAMTTSATAGPSPNAGITTVVVVGSAMTEQPRSITASHEMVDGQIASGIAERRRPSAIGVEGMTPPPPLRDRARRRSR